MSGEWSEDQDASSSPTNGNPPLTAHHSPPINPVAEAVRQETAKLHAGDAENVRLWQMFMPWCREEIDRIYRRLDVRFDHTHGESFYNPMLPDVVRSLLERGIAEPALVVGLRDRRRTLTEPAFVGRDNEFGVLDHHLGLARMGQGGLVVLEAESGGGKTRLLAELAQRSAQQGAWVLRGQGLETIWPDLVFLVSFAAGMVVLAAISLQRQRA